MSQIQTKSSNERIKEVLNIYGRIPQEYQQSFNVAEIIHYMNTVMLKDGKVDCPVCGSHHQTYKRTVSKTLIYWLEALRILSKNGVKQIHFKKVDQYLYERLKLNASDYIILKHWNLIIPVKKLDPKTEKEVYTGEYTITSVGLDFLRGDITIPKYIYLSNGKVFKKSPEQITPIDAKNFDKNDLTKLKY